MIKKNDEYRIDLRHQMRGGNGEVQIEHLWKPETELKSKTRLAARLTLQPGVSIGIHPHKEEEEIFYIVSGEGLANDNGKQTKLSAGDTMLTGGGDSHSIICVSTEEPLVIVAVISEY